VLRLARDYAAQPNNLALALQLARAYGRHRRLEALDQHLGRIVARKDLSVEQFLQIAQVYADLREVDRLLKVALLMTQRHPQSGMAWYTLARVHGVRNDCANCIAALERAVSFDTADGKIRGLIERDPRLSNCRMDPAFSRLLFPLSR
jgi:predicted Zn-dependent protease